MQNINGIKKSLRNLIALTDMKMRDLQATSGHNTWAIGYHEGRGVGYRYALAELEAMEDSEELPETNLSTDMFDLLNSMNRLAAESYK